MTYVQRLWKMAPGGSLALFMNGVECAYGGYRRMPIPEHGGSVDWPDVEDKIGATVDEMRIVDARGAVLMGARFPSGVQALLKGDNVRLTDKEVGSVEEQMQEIYKVFKEAP